MSSYNERAQMIIREIERILMKDAARSQGVRIEIVMEMDSAPTISFEIQGMMVR